MSFLVLAAVPTELADGRYPAPAWVIVAVGIATVAGAVAYLGVRLRRSRLDGRGPPAASTRTRPTSQPKDER